MGVGETHDVCTIDKAQKVAKERIQQLVKVEHSHSMKKAHRIKMIGTKSKSSLRTSFFSAALSITYSFSGVLVLSSYSCVSLPVEDLCSMSIFDTKP